ncbi:MAG: type II toxin-antitoxin system RelE/ParE family toxin [Phycisphaerae bacterium]
MSANRVELSPAADSDLLEIWHYVASDNPTAADRLLESLSAASRQLATMPLSGRVRSDLLPELRSLAVGMYVVYYTPTLFGIRIYRVLHGARDAATEFRRPC